MKKSISRTNVSFKCHYCGGGKEGNLITTRSSTIPSKSLERDKRIVSAKSVSRSKSMNNGFLPPIAQTTDFSYIPGRLLTEDDLREELIQLKRRYGLLSKEHSVLKTHLQVAANDLKKRELEIENLLQDPVTPTKYQEQLELNSLKRKVIQYERAMREKSEEISKLLSDKDLFNATENRQKLEKLEKDYEKLKYRLGKSVPHAELEAEKARLAELIESLHRENNELHQILSTFFQDAENGVFFDGVGIRDSKLLAKMKEEATARKNEVEYYQRALAALIRDKSYHGSGALGSSSRKSQTPSGNKRPKSSKVVLNGHQPNAVPLLNKISLPNIPREKDKTKRAKSTEKPLVLKPINKSTSYQSSKKKTEREKPTSKYAESESSMKSANESESEYEDNNQKSRIRKRIGSEESSIGSYVTNEEFEDNDSNIGKITNEYLEKLEIEEKTETLITALRCQLLREEMLQTRVISF